MFYENQHADTHKKYRQYLKVIGALSKLSSDSETPYLYYRMAEKVFCASFEAKDLSRSDVSSDAAKDGVGIGLKTFLAGNNQTFQKVAEFNKARSSYSHLSSEDLVFEIARLRNKRLNFTRNAYDLDKAIYHCVVRDAMEFRIFEESMADIDVDSIQNIKKKRNTITFEDGNAEYSFSLSKSTLLKRFITSEYVDRFVVRVLDNPLDELVSWFNESSSTTSAPIRIVKSIFLPLYGRGGRVFDRSGLNQWNAMGRKRDPNEIYIPVPIWIHKKFPTFFPDRETPFDLILPNGKSLKSKICQDGGKALMSYSNKELGKWLLRDVLGLEEGQLVTTESLIDLGIDSVRIDKLYDGTFEINFSKLDSYEHFRSMISKR